jgi:hypothetical protein
MAKVLAVVEGDFVAGVEKYVGGDSHRSSCRHEP